MSGGCKGEMGRGPHTEIRDCHPLTVSVPYAVMFISKIQFQKGRIISLFHLSMPPLLEHLINVEHSS